MKFVVLLSSFLFTSILSLAQATYTNGCYVASERRAYVISGSTCLRGFEDCGSSTTGNFIVISRRTTTACTTCAFGGTTRSGVVVDFIVYRCALDDYIPYLILPIGIFGFIYFRRRELTLAVISH